MSWSKLLAFACVLFVASPSWAAVGTIYADTPANGGVNTSSGTTDTANSALVTCTGGTAWLVTTGCKGTAAGTSGGTSPNYTIVLDTNTNLTGMPVDGSQAIFYNNATNTSDKIFWITTVTGCTGSGACSVTVNSSTGIQPTCTTCTAVATWAIGGRITLPATVHEGGLRGGDTVLVNSTLASCGGAACFTFRTPGDVVNGPITLIGKGSYPTLVNSGNFSTVTTSGNPGNILITNLTIQSAGTAATIVLSTGGASIVKNIKVNSSGSGACITMTAGSSVLDSDLTGCTGAGITTTASNIQVIGNYIHAVGGDCILQSVVAPAGTIADNLLTDCGGWGLNLSGATATYTTGLVVEGNTFSNSSSGGINVANKQTGIRVRNNVFYETTNSAVNFSYPAVSGVADVNLLAGGSHKYNNYFTGGAGGANFANVVQDATETITDPVFTSVGGGDYSIATSGGAFNTGGPPLLLDSGTHNYRSSGAAQLNGLAATLNVGIVH